MVDNVYIVKSTPLRAFTGSFQHCRYFTEILKMCLKKFDAEKLFFDKPTEFLTQMCYRHIEDVHEDV